MAEYPKAPTKAALGHLRISDKGQIKGESKHNQRSTIETYAKNNGIKVIKWFYDEAKSGKNTEREELQNLLKLALKMKGSIDYVLVYKMNRASRDLDSYVIGMRSVLASRGIEVRSVTEPFDSSPMGRFMENLYVMVGQLDNENKRETVVDNMRRLAQQGYWQHKAIRGYRMVKVSNSEGQPRPSMQPNEEAEKITDVLMRFNQGDITEAALIRYAAKVGVLNRKGKHLSQETLHKMLIRPEYAGYVHDWFTDYELVEGKHQGLISKDAYWRNQQIIKSKNKEYLLGLKHTTNSELYPLRRFILCANCNQSMTGCAPSDSPRYFCGRKTCRGKGSVMTKIAHSEFEHYLKSIEPTQDTLKKIKNNLNKQSVEQLGVLNKEIADLRDKLTGISDLRASTIKQFISGKINEEEKKEVIDSLDSEKLDLKQSLDALEQEQTLSESSIDYALNFMSNVAKQWSDAPLQLKQKYQNLIFPRGFIYDIKQHNFISQEISLLYRYVLEENDPLNASDSVMVIPRRIELLLPG